MASVQVGEQALLSEVVFAVGEQAYRWDDVILAAGLWGEWAGLEEQVRQGLAGQKRLAGMGEALDSADVTAAANRFRYARELLTTEELEAWLCRWVLTTEAWIEQLERSLVRRRWSAEAAQMTARYPVSAEEVDRAIWAEAVCSGELERLATKLAGRAAAAACIGGQTLEGSQAPATEPAGASGEHAEVYDVLAEVSAHGLAGVPARERHARLDHLLALERRFHRFRRQVLTPAALCDAIQTHALDWIRVRCQSAAFSSEQMAREAALCVREDGEALGEVARAAHAPVTERWLYLNEATPAARPLFLSAESPSLLGPLPEVGQYMLVRVAEKIPPSPADPLIRARAEDAVLRTAVNREVNRRVRWEAKL